MKTMWKRLLGFLCVLTLLMSLLGVLPALAIEGGGLQSNQSYNVAFGCDLSFWNVGGSQLDHSLVDFNKMKADGCEFAILRIGYEGSKTRTDTLDTAFLEFYRQARAAGMDLGVYFYALSTTYAGAVQDAQWVMSIIEKYDMYFEYPIYYDVEDSAQTSLGSSAMNSLCRGWCETLEAGGYFPGIYGGKSQVIDKLTSTFKATYDTWLPSVTVNGHGTQYNPNTKHFRGTTNMWQYAWYDCNYNGIGLDMLDVNVSYKDYPAIIEGGGWNNTAVRHKITFESNGGTAVDPLYVKEGTAATPPTAPTRWGFDFAGWYCDAELQDPYDFSGIIPNYDFTLYAKWDEAYWGANTNLMPQEGALTPRLYNEAGDKLWPYWNATTGACSMYSGVNEYAWPSAYMLYANSFDANNDSHLYIKKDGNAMFNVELTYMDATGKLHSIKASEILGLPETDFPAGYWEGFVDVAGYIRDQGHMPESGNVKYTQVDYYVIGEKDQCVNLYECRMTPVFKIADPYVSLMNATISSQNGIGDYVYDNGVLTMNSTSQDSYTVTMDVQTSIKPREFVKMLTDVSSTADFNITVSATNASGPCNISFNTEFFDRFDITGGVAPAALPAGDWNVSMNLLGYYEWNGGAPDESVIDSVTVTVYGEGTLVLSALQASRTETITYVEDGAYAEGSYSGVAAELTSSVYTVTDTVVKGVPQKSTVVHFLANLDQTNAVVVDETGHAVAVRAFVATGMKVRVMDGTKVLREYAIAVSGDANSDGMLTTSDARLMLVAIADAVAFDDVTAAAYDLDGNGAVDALDARLVLLTILL